MSIPKELPVVLELVNESQTGKDCINRLSSKMAINVPPLCPIYLELTVLVLRLFNNSSVDIDRVLLIHNNFGLMKGVYWYQVNIRNTGKRVHPYFYV